MRLHKAVILATFLLPSPLLASMVITNAPKAAAAGGGGSGSIQKVQSTADRIGGDTPLTLTSVGTPPRLLVMSGWGGDANAPTDNQGHTFTLAKSQPMGGGPIWVYYYVTTATYATITVTKTWGSVSGGVALTEFSTSLSSFTLDVTTGSTNAASTTYQTKASATTSADSSLVVASVGTDSGVNSAITGPAGWGQLFTESDGSSYFAGATHFSTATVASQNINAQWTGPNTTSGATLAVFK
jgi:hypothetical protein